MQSLVARRALIALLALAPLAAMPRAHAQDFPSRPVELIVPFSPGGGSDILARLVADGLGKRLGQSFVVINRPGANTNIGMLSVARAHPDGYTLLLASLGLAANPSLYAKLRLDPLTDLAPITLVANAPTVLVVPHSLPVTSLPEFIAYAKARPGELNFGSFGAGSGAHLAAELFMSLTGTKLVHVPYGGGASAATAVMANQVQALFSSALPVLGMIQAGKLRAIAIASDGRSAMLPDVPTFREGGLDFRTGTWFGLLAPAKTPAAVVARLHRETVALLRNETVRDRIAKEGAEVVGDTPEEFRAFLKDETERLSRVIRAANIRLD